MDRDLFFPFILSIGEKKISNENTSGESIMEETIQVNDGILGQEMRGGGEDWKPSLSKVRMTAKVQACEQ